MFKDRVRHKIANLKKKYPDSTLRQLACYCGVSPETIRKICLEYGLKTKHHNKNSNILVSCKTCGVLFRKRMSEILRTERDFCSKKCQGKWLGEGKFKVG